MMRGTSLTQALVAGIAVAGLLIPGVEVGGGQVFARTAPVAATYERVTYVPLLN